MKHQLKSWSHLFGAIASGAKKYDLRDDRDRGFVVGDEVQLNEFDIVTGKYTGNSLTADITYITSRETPCAVSSVVLSPGFVILGINTR